MCAFAWRRKRTYETIPIFFACSAFSAPLRETRYTASDIDADQHPGKS